jgi:hypothetical protein
MGSQEASPQTQFWKPSNLVNEFVRLFLVLDFIPDHPAFRFAMGVGRGVYRRWQSGHCVDAWRTHELRTAIVFPYPVR